MKIVTASEVYLLNGEYKKIVEIRCDALADVSPPDPSWAIGSIAWVIKDEITEKGKFYGLTSAGEWVEQIIR